MTQRTISIRSRMRQRITRTLSAAAALCMMSGPILAACEARDLRDDLTAEARRTIAAKLEAMPYARGRFWRATRPGRELVIIGTMHINDPRMGDLAADLAPHLADADVMLVEASEEDQARLQETIGKSPELVLITEGPTLIDLLPPEEWEDVAALARAGGIPPFMAAKMRPWFLAMSLALPTCARQMAEIKNGLDARLMTEAAARDLPVRSLEDPLTIFEAFNRDPLDRQVADLRSYLSSMSVDEASYHTLTESYFDDDIQTFMLMEREAFLSAPGPVPRAQREAEFDEVMEPMLVQRNHNWIPVIEATKGARIVLAFGAAHLPGEDGILRLLEQQGYEISPLTP